ncbi:S8 family serine peptidase [Arsukibacterium indicum]|uniref:S8 family serine peptidase n=1 Tax=Arsukibacterium indicum TaxID=2848612 RepID=A0ABS6MPX8_9GAMM|nr:S8 family serine peptidase [Arsukibacterium indicum]MBV2130887.1 S8 family serine peptidase [Arsukibacterium indicum]
MNKALLATAVSLALSGYAQAGITKIKPAGQQSVHELFGDVTVSLAEQTPSAWYVLLKAPAASYALQGENFNQAQAQQLTLEAETVQQRVSQVLFNLNPDAKVLTKTTKLAVGMVITADTATLQALKQNALVVDIMPVYDSELHVADSAEYIKAAQTVLSGKATGAGVKVAILDSGVDFTHAAFGGEGTPEAYAAAFADQTAPQWPQGQIKGGFDFVGNDPNPIDPINDGIGVNGGGHGTSVAHSVTGIAPGVDLYAYKICTRSCPGANQIAALEAAMDPNGDGNLADRVDVINMSLGGEFGSTSTISGTQFLIQRASDLGVNMVISAGNDGNVPFRVGGPSTTPNALSVGAMSHPTSAVGVFSSSAIDGETVEMVSAGFNPTFDFSFTSTDTPLVLVPGEYTACDPLAEDADLTGKAVLLSRGTCPFSQKVLNAQARGAAFVIIANSNPGEAPIVAGGDGTGITIPTVMITKEVGDAIRAMLLEETEVSYAITSEARSGADAVAGFSSRGPSMDGLLKPEITAPGVNIMVADVGTGDGLAPATGTSFSGPITAGAVALLREALPERNAAEIKATLMNSANLNVFMDAPDINPDAAVAPISLIGAGLVDVEKAVNLPVAAWVHEPAFDTRQAALSFGLQTLTAVSSMTKTVTLKNFSMQERTYELSVEDRFADKTATGATSWEHPAAVTVPAGQSVQFDVTLTIDPSKLPAFGLVNQLTWTDVGIADALSRAEFDGALVFNDTNTDSEHDLHMVYHVIPKPSAQLTLASEMVSEELVTTLTNTGVVPVEPVASALVATSPMNSAVMPQHDIATITLNVDEAAWCSTGYAFYPTFHLAGGINHLLQGNYALDLDIDGDGILDYTMNTLLVTRLGTAYAAFPGGMVSFNTRFGELSGALGDVYHFAGGKQVTLESCFEDIGLTADDIGSDIVVRFRTNANSYSLSSANTADQLVSLVRVELTPEISLSSEPMPEANITAQNEDETAVDTTVEMLAPGEKAYVVRDANDNRSFVMLSAQAEAVAIADFSSAVAEPVVVAEQVMMVSENAANGTVVGQVAATSDFRTVITEIVTLASSSSAFSINSNGEVVVANSAALDYEAGMMEVTFEVAAIDANGSISEPATVTVMVNNVPDEQPDVTVNVTTPQLLIGSAAGTVLGNVDVVVNEADATLVSVTTNNPLFTVDNGQLKLARMPVKSDVRMHTITIAATDSAGMRGTTNVQVTVNKGSSGSFGIFALLLLPLAWLRRRTN